MSDTPAPHDLGRLIDLLESRALPLLERIAVALERSSALRSQGSAIDSRTRGLLEFRQALEQGQFVHAESIVRELALENPGDPEVAALSDELGRRRQFVVDDLRGRIEAARMANDPSGAISSRDELGQILHGEAIQDIDRPLVKWLLVVIQKRLRTGTVRPDVVALAGRIAESFAATTEGASLRASLPTLRRAAGLCPKCAEPYAGVGDACPKCLAAAPVPIPAEILEDEPPQADEPDEEVIGEPIDLNNERFWQSP